MKKVVSIIVAGLLACSLAACGSGSSKDASEAVSESAVSEAVPESEAASEAAESEAAPEETAPEAKAESETAEDPYMDPDPAVAAQYPGTWVCGRASMSIEASEDDTFMVFIDWGGSASETAHWEYTCYFDGVSLVDDGRGVLENIVYKEDGEIDSSEIVYSDGAGKFTIQENGKLTWEEFKENAADGMEFEKMDDMVAIPAAEEFAEKYFKAVAGYHAGTAGSSLAQAQAACSVLAFADGSGLYAAETDADAAENMRAAMLGAWESLTDDERSTFDENIIPLSELIDSCFSDWDSVHPTFEDAGVADQMEEFIYDPLARVAWSALFGNTLTLGNSED